MIRADTEEVIELLVYVAIEELLLSYLVYVLLLELYAAR